MELVLVRHALPIRIDATEDGSPADPPLSEVGRQQAERLPAALAADRVDALYTSPMTRARQTAEPLARALGLSPVVVDGLAEFDVAHPTYVPVEEIRAAGGPEWDALVRGDLGSAAVDPQAFRERVVSAVAGIAARHPGGRAVLVSHSGTINVYAGDVLGQERPLWFAPAYCSLTRLAVARGGRRGVLSLNETAHVRDLLPER